MLLRLVWFVYVGMHPILYTSAYKLKSKLLKTDGARWTMFRMSLVHTQDNGSGISSTEPECTVGIRTYYMHKHDLLYAWTGIECHRSQRNKLRGLRHTRQEDRGVGVPVQPMETLGGLQVDPKY